jgi:hypothetical protein
MVLARLPIRRLTGGYQYGEREAGSVERGTWCVTITMDAFGVDGFAVLRIP